MLIFRNENNIGEETKQIRIATKQINEKPEFELISQHNPNPFSIVKVENNVKPEESVTKMFIKCVWNKKFGGNCRGILRVTNNSQELNITIVAFTNKHKI